MAKGKGGGRGDKKDNKPAVAKKAKVAPKVAPKGGPKPTKSDAPRRLNMGYQIVKGKPVLDLKPPPPVLNMGYKLSSAAPSKKLGGGKGGKPLVRRVQLTK